MTDVIYNGVRISNCITRQFRQLVRYDESGTDLLGTEIHLVVEGYIHGQHSLSFHGIGRGTYRNVADEFAAVSMALSQPRKELRVYWRTEAGMVLVMHAVPGTSENTATNTDVDHGPKPTELEVVRVTPRAVLVRWGVKTTVSFCADSQQVRGPAKIIYNKWQVEETLNADWYTSRRITGRIRFSEGLTAKHALRGAITPILEQGFRREMMQYSVSESGLEASYIIEDRQVHYSAPPPATDMRVTHTDSSNDGVTWLSNVTIELTGSPAASRQALLQRLVEIMDQRTRILSGTDQQRKNLKIEHVAITEEFGESNRVRGDLTVKYFYEKTSDVTYTLRDRQIGQPLELRSYNRTQSQTPPLFGEQPHGRQRDPSTLFLLECYVQDPCSTAKTIGRNQPSRSQLYQPQQDSTSPYVEETPRSPSQSRPQLTYNQSHEQAMYTLATVRVTFDADFGRPVVPLGIDRVNIDANPDALVAKLVPTLHVPVYRRMVDLLLERVGALPELPRLDQAIVERDGAFFIRNRWKVIAEPPRPDPSGSQLVMRVRVLIWETLLGTNLQQLWIGTNPIVNVEPARLPLSGRNPLNL